MLVFVASLICGNPLKLAVTRGGTSEYIPMKNGNCPNSEKWGEKKHNLYIISSTSHGIWFNKRILLTTINVMVVKQCHKPPMTGNGKHSTYKNGDDWGWFMKLIWNCFNHITAQYFRRYSLILIHGLYIHRQMWTITCSYTKWDAPPEWYAFHKLRMSIAPHPTRVGILGMQKRLRSVPNPDLGW